MCKDGISTTTTCTWVASNCSAIIQLANTDTHGVIFLQGTIVGHVTPARTIASHCVRTNIAEDLSEVRAELEPALANAFEKNTLDADQ